MSEPITCLIVDDHEVVREGLRLSLSRSENIRVVGEASDGQAAVTLAKRRKPNVVILLSDDQAWTDYGFMGHPTIQTPHLDRLA